MSLSFLSFDGVDGVGKSTQVELCCDWLAGLGHDVARCRDPGGTELGEAIRGILLDRHDLNFLPRSEMLLYMASRAQLVEEVIRPALAAEKLVVCDRFLLANVVYQGHAGGLDIDLVWQVGQVATAGLLPDLSLVLDMDVVTAASRIGCSVDRMEARGLDYMRRVRQGFLAEAARHPDRIRVVNAGQDVLSVQQEIREAVLTTL